MSAVVTAVGLTRGYRTSGGRVTAVRDVCLSVDSRQIVGISGPSGSGKSTLLRLLAGIERPDSGVVRFGDSLLWPAGSRVARYPRPGHVMPVFQDPFASLDSRWPIWRILTEPLTAPGRVRMRRDQLRVVAERWLERAGLGHVDPGARPGQLSGGQCQRVAILRALVAEPALIVADEPTARQDVVTASAMGELLVEAARRGAAVVVVSHDIGWLDTVVHRRLAMRPGGLLG